MILPRVAALLAALALTAPARAATPPLEITLAHDSANEKATAAQLLRLARQYDLAPWIHTTRIVIDERAIPHSHPVLTLHTAHLKKDDELLSTFVHEQSHWYLVAHEDRFRAAREDLRKLYPAIPVGFPEGSSDEIGNYAHLLIIQWEYEADQKLLGKARAEAVMAHWARHHYTWLYRTVWAHPDTLAAIAARHGLDPAAPRS